MPIYYLSYFLPYCCSDAGRWKHGNLPSLVGIGLTDLPNIGGALWPPWHPRFRQYCVVLTSWFSLRTIFYCSFHVPFALFFTHNFCYFRIISEIRLIWNIEIWNKLMLWLHLKKIFSNLQKKGGKSLLGGYCSRVWFFIFFVCRELN